MALSFHCVYVTLYHCVNPNRGLNDFGSTFMFVVMLVYHKFEQDTVEKPSRVHSVQFRVCVLRYNGVTFDRRQFLCAQSVCCSIE